MALSWQQHALAQVLPWESILTTVVVAALYYLLIGCSPLWGRSLALLCCLVRFTLLLCLQKQFNLMVWHIVSEHVILWKIFDGFSVQSMHKKRILTIRMLQVPLDSSSDKRTRFGTSSCLLPTTFTEPTYLNSVICINYRGCFGTPGASSYQSGAHSPWHIPSFKIRTTQSSICRQFYAFLIWNLNKLLSSPCWLSINSDDFPCH